MASRISAIVSLTLSVAAVTLMLPRGVKVLPKSSSSGFFLTANVSGSADLQPTVQGMFLHGYHIGAGMDAAVLVTPEPEPTGTGNANYNGNAGRRKNKARVFYLNGTDPSNMSLISDGGSYPYGLTVSKTRSSNRDSHGAGEYKVTIDVGGGTNARVVEAEDSHQVYVENGLGPGTFLACRRWNDYYRKELVVLAYAYGTCSPKEWQEQEKRQQTQKWHRDDAGDASYGGRSLPASPCLVTTPTGCVAITLVPYCAALPEVPPASYISHEHARNVSCFEGV